MSNTHSLPQLPPRPPYLPRLSIPTWSYPVLKGFNGRPIIVGVHDGDTIRLLLDAGCETGLFPWLRVRNVNCPELKQQDGKESLNFTFNELLNAQDIVVHIHGRSFNRWVADIIVDNTNLADTIISNGYGIRFNP